MPVPASWYGAVVVLTLLRIVYHSIFRQSIHVLCTFRNLFCCCLRRFSLPAIVYLACSFPTFLKYSNAFSHYSKVSDEGRGPSKSFGHRRYVDGKKMTLRVPFKMQGRQQ